MISSAEMKQITKIILNEMKMKSWSQQIIQLDLESWNSDNEKWRKNVIDCLKLIAVCLTLMSGLWALTTLKHHVNL